MSQLVSSPQWKALLDHWAIVSKQQMRDLFAKDPARFNSFSLKFEDILLDFSKNRITAETMRLLRDLATAADLKGWTREDVRGGEDQHHRGSRGAAHRAAQSVATGRSWWTAKT